MHEAPDSRVPSVPLRFSRSLMQSRVLFVVANAKHLKQYIPCMPEFLQILAKLPALRELNLAFNYFTGVSLTPEAVEYAFPLLEGLDLGFNYIGNEDDVVVLVLLERLQRIILYGNPLAGPTGEDSLGLCVEGLIEKADRCERSILEQMHEMCRVFRLGSVFRSKVAQNVNRCQRARFFFLLPCVRPCDAATPKARTTYLRVVFSSSARNASKYYYTTVRSIVTHSQMTQVLKQTRISRQPMFFQSSNATRTCYFHCIFNMFVVPYLVGRVREGWASYPIEFITEMPRKKQTLGGGGRRRRPYGDIGVTMVDEGYVPSAAAFRTAGNNSLFRFERPDEEGVEFTDAIVEATLRSAEERGKRRAGASSRHGEQDFTFLTGIDRQDDAAGLEEQEEGPADVAGVPGLDQAGMSARLLRRPIDPMVRGDPVKLRMAVSALRYTLKHPVTSSMDVSWKQDQEKNTDSNTRGDASKSNGGGAGRKTAAARARQLPRRPYRLLRTHQGLHAGLLDGPPRNVALGTVDEVLTSMGVGMDEMTLEKRARRSFVNSQQPGRPALSSIIQTVNAVLDEHEY